MSFLFVIDIGVGWGEWCSKHAPSSANVTAVLLQIFSFLRGKFSSFEYPYGPLCQLYKVVSRTVMGLRVYSPCKLASEPATVSWMLAEDTRHLVRNKDFY